MDQRVRYKLSDKAFNRRAELLSRLDDAAEQKRECGILAAALESAANQQDWNLVERLTLALNRIRESQQKAKERSGELVDVTQFRHTILAPLLDAIAGRIQEALPEKYEETIDLILNDIHGVNPRLLLEGPKHD